MKGMITFLTFLLYFFYSFYSYAGTNPLDDLYRRTYHISNKGEILFASTTAGLTVYKIRGQNIERLSAFIVENGSSYSIVDGNYLYLFAGGSGVKKLDISDPSSIKLIKDVKVPGSALNGDIYGDLLFVSLGSLGFAIISKKNLEVVSHIETLSYCSYLKVIANRLIVFTEKNGAILYKISGNSIKQISSIELKFKVRDLVLGGDYIFLANDIGGISVLRNRQDKFEVIGRFDTPDVARGVAVYKNFLLVADGNTGIMVFEILEDGDLRLIRKRKTDYSTNKVLVLQDMLIVSHDAMGILRISLYDLIK